MESFYTCIIEDLIGTAKKYITSYKEVQPFWHLLRSPEFVKVTFTKINPKLKIDPLYIEKIGQALCGNTSF